MNVTWDWFYLILICLQFNPKKLRALHISNKFIRDAKCRIYSLPMNLHKTQLYLK